MNKTLCFIISLFFYVISANCQYYENGQDPFSLKWKVIKTPHFKIIFPDEVDSIGIIYANYLERIYSSGGTTLDHKPRKIPVIIHNRNVLSNGEVAWAPKRMNLYTLSPQSGDFEPYIRTLALHEFRHVVQIDKLNKSSSRVLYYLLGEQVIGAIAGWHIPRWFFEGDAVAYETGASISGRGRQPDFDMKLKAQVSQYGIYSYPKAQFGSFKHFVPNHYELGYQLVARADKKYGAGLWSKTLDQVARVPIHANSFSKGIKKLTGLPERKLYWGLMHDFADENKKTGLNDSSSLLSNEYENFYAPYLYGNNIIAYKTNLSDISHIIIIDSLGDEKSLITTGSVFDETLSCNDSIIVWNDFKGTRWENENYCRIVKYNVITRKLNYLTKTTRAFYSRISPDNSKILSVEVDNKLNWSLTFRNANDGILEEAINFKNGNPVQANWSPDMQEIVFMKVDSFGKSLGIIDLKSRNINWILKDEFIDLSYPIHTGNAILIKGIANNVTNYLKYDLDKKQWFQITDASYGVGEGSVKNNKLIYTEYTPRGYKIKTIDLREVKPLKIDKPGIYETALNNLLSKQEQQIDFTKIDSSYIIEKYHRLPNLINVHSWAPLGINIQNFEWGPGATILSQNALSTSTLSGGYQYYLPDSSHRYFADYSYKGFFPILDLTLSKAYHNDSLPDSSNNLYHVTYNNTSVIGTVSLPFNLDRGMWFTRIQPQLTYEYNEIKASEENTVQIHEPVIHNFAGQLYMYNLSETSHRDLQPKWGQILNFRYMCTPFDFSQMGRLATSEMWLYFPGIFKNHGIKLYGGYQWKQRGDFSYSDRLFYPHGYAYLQNTQMVSLQANYQFPVLYPDLNIYEFLYIKRLKMNGFYQFAGFINGTHQFDISSAGADLTANLHLFRFVFPMEMGVRYARMIDYNSNYYQFLFNVNF